MKETTLAQLMAGQLPQVALDRLIDSSTTTTARRLPYASYFLIQSMARPRMRPDATSFPHRPQGAGVGLILRWPDPAKTVEVRA
jgi:hypothetical protein